MIRRLGTILPWILLLLLALRGLAAMRVDGATADAGTGRRVAAPGRARSRRALRPPGTRVTGNLKLRLEHRFPPVRTTGLRLLIERERNEQGEDSPNGAFRAACLELAAYVR
jgi:hypothetical protein